MAESNPTETGLERWLRIATYDLCEEAKPRLRAEIEEHFWSAVEEAMAQGKSREIAEGVALKALGNPFDAQVAFNRKHLTCNDLKLIRGFSGGPVWGDPREMRKAIVLAGLATALFQVIYVVFMGWAKMIEVLSQGLSRMLCVVLVVWLVYRIGPRWLGQSLRSRLLVNSFALTAMWLAGFIYDFWMAPELAAAMGFYSAYLVFLVVHWAMVGPVIRKLGKEQVNDPTISQRGPDQYA